MPVVLDASAMIAFLRGETGAAVVTEYIERSSLTAVAHALNLCEVFYDFWRAGGPEIAQNAVNDLLWLGIAEPNDMGPQF